MNFKTDRNHKTKNNTKSELLLISGVVKHLLQENELSGDKKIPV